MKKRECIGLFGGTFNPVHVGHVDLVRAALRELDRVIVMPCRISPHKLHQQADRQLVPAEHRCAMLEACFRDMPGVEVSRWEIDRGEISFTWMTLEALRSRHPGAEIVLILGWDQFALLPSWDKFEKWAPGTEFLIFRRQGEGNAAALSPECESLDYRVVEGLLPEISSSDLRMRLARGEEPAGLVPGPVLEYIKAHGLYGAGGRAV